MKKVLFITNIPAPYRIDFYNELGKYLDLTVLFEAKGASDQGIRFNWNYEKINNFKAIFLSNGDIKERTIDWSIFKYLKPNLYDEIVVTNYSYFTEMVAILYLKALKIPYYMETDGGIIRSESLLKRSYKKFLVSGAKGYFSPSMGSDDYLVHYGAKRKLIHRYPFTSISEKDILDETVPLEEKKRLRNELGLPDVFIILGVGQIIPRKGWDILIKALKYVNEDISLYIVGGKATEEYINLIKSESMEKRIMFIPFLASEKIMKYYCAADVFVLPTREDIWGLVVNEAMGKALPVITTNKCVAGLELVKDHENGIIVDSDNVDALAKAINELHNRELLTQYSENALQRSREYTVEAMVSEHLKVLC